jgi:hypothetical protein
MSIKALLGSALVTTALVGYAGTASAYGYHNNYDEAYGFFSLGAAFNYGIWTGKGDVNGFGPAVGVRGGVSLDPGLYLGADFDYFFGEERSASAFGATGDSRFNIYDVMGEVGWDFWLHRHGLLRPKFGFGVGVAKGTVCVGAAGVSGCSGSSTSGFAFSAGAEYLHYFGVGFLSFEARYENVSIDGPDPNAVILGIGVGATL